MHSEEYEKNQKVTKVGRQETLCDTVSQLNIVCAASQLLKWALFILSRGRKERGGKQGHGNRGVRGVKWPS